MIPKTIRSFLPMALAFFLLSLVPVSFTFASEDIDPGLMAPLGYMSGNHQNSVNHGRQEKLPHKPGPSGPSPLTLSASANMDRCSMEHIKGLAGDDLLAYLKDADMECLRFLASFSEDSPSVFSQANMSTVMDEIARLAPSYAGNNQQGLWGLVIFGHIGYYLNYYYSQQLPFDHTLIEKTQFAMNQMTASRFLLDSNDEAAQILAECITIIDASGLVPTSIPLFKKILRFYVGSKERQLNYYHNYVVYSTLYTTQRIISYPAAVPVEKRLIDFIRQVAILTDHLDANSYVVNNAIWTLGRLIGYIPRLDATLVQALTQALDTHVYLGEQYLWTVSTLDTFNKCQTARTGEQICKKDLIPVLMQKNFPQTYAFDDGAIVFRTALPLDTLQPLYHAIKQVEGQFNRITQTITPLEDDPNGVIKMFIYQSRKDYEMYHSFLFDLSTNNGGIYIEQQGALYTYQRTSDESIYTLEELLRHEYAHYLVSRFQIQGMWGESPIYDHNRMVWFDEGLAEFLTGSIPTDIPARKVLVQSIINDSTQRMGIADIVSATYDSFKFYRYAGTFFHYLYTTRKDILMEVLRLSRESDGAGFDALMSSLKNDTELNLSYLRYLDTLITNIDSLSDPITQAPAFDTLTADLRLIQRSFRQTRLGYMAKCSMAAAAINSRFSCRGYLTGTVTREPNPIQSWDQFNQGLNEILTQLNKDNAPSNLRHTNCRMGAIGFVNYPDETSYPITDYYCDGPLAQSDWQFPSKWRQVTMDFHSTRFGRTATCSLIEGNIVRCVVTLTSRSYPLLTPDKLLTYEIQRDMGELKNQVYAIRPNYYRDFDCSFAGDGKMVLIADDTQKYYLQDVQCHVN